MKWNVFLMVFLFCEQTLQKFQSFFLLSSSKKKTLKSGLFWTVCTHQEVKSNGKPTCRLKVNPVDKENLSSGNTNLISGTVIQTRWNSLFNSYWKKHTSFTRICIKLTNTRTSLLGIQRTNFLKTNSKSTCSMFYCCNKIAISQVDFRKELQFSSLVPIFFNIALFVR